MPDLMPVTLLLPSVGHSPTRADISDIRGIYVGNSRCANPVLLRRNPDQIRCTTTWDESSPNLPGPVDIQVFPRPLSAETAPSALGIPGYGIAVTVPTRAY